MRTGKEMYELLIGFAQKEERIRLVTLEGSRTNPTIPDDEFKDYDVSYFVTDMDSFKKSDKWLDVFGKRIILQKPEAMELYPPELGNWFSYLMLFEDGNKVDLTLIPLEEIEGYFAKSDGLVRVLLDKDNRMDQEIVPTDEKYWIKKPSAKEFDDCCNEFWWVNTYVAKGLARGEFLFALDHLNAIVRTTLLQMMAWQIGSKKGYNFSLGKNYKFMQQHLPEEDWNELIHTYATDGYSKTWEALCQCHELFRKYAKEVAYTFEYPYPDYDENVTRYIEKLYNRVT